MKGACHAQTASLDSGLGTDPLWIVLSLLRGSAGELGLASTPLGFSHLLPSPMEYFAMVILKKKKKRKERKKRKGKKELEGEQETMSMLSVYGPREALVS